MTALKEQYHGNMTIEEAQKMILQTLKNVMEEGISKDNVELTIIKSDTRKWEKLSTEQLDEIITTLT